MRETPTIESTSRIVSRIITALTALMKFADLEILVTFQKTNGPCVLHDSYSICDR